ncbi:MAG TPA: ester cyclase [Eubacteriales bacterium]|nr:ester cyclase [Eubacteriales bacterium]
MDNKARMRYFYEHVVSDHLLDEVPAFIAPECAVRSGETLVPAGVGGMIRHLAEVRRTYPDYKMTVTRQFEDGDFVISEFVMEGTHAGEWLGMKPTNKKLIFTGVNVDRIANGKIVEHGGAVNTFDTLFAEQIIRPS